MEAITDEPAKSKEKAKAAKNKRKRENAKRKKLEAASNATQKKSDLNGVLSNLNDLQLDGESTNQVPEKWSTTPRMCSLIKPAQQLLTMFVEDRSTLFEVKPSSKKGLGVFALQSIEAGGEIFREAALIHVTREWLAIEACYNCLSPEKKAQFMSLKSHCHCGEVPCRETAVMKIFDTNSFGTLPYETGGDQIHQPLYAIASRINHSCVPNAIRCFTNDLHISIRARRRINKGEEIYMDYLGTSALDDRVMRRHLLLDKFHFVCTCSACRAGAKRPIPMQSLISGGNKFLNGLVLSWQEMRKLEKQGQGESVLGKNTKEELAKFNEINELYADLIAEMNSPGLNTHKILAAGVVCKLDYDATISQAAEMEGRRRSKVMNEKNKFALGRDVVALWQQRTAHSVVTLAEDLYLQLDLKQMLINRVMSRMQ